MSIMARMSNRERFATILKGEVPDRVPLVTRMDLWYTAGKQAGTLPEEVKDLSLAEIEDRMQMGRSARFRSFQLEIREHVNETVQQDGEQTIRRLEVGGRSVREVSIHTTEQKNRGMLGQTREYYLKTAEDYRTMIQLWERTKIVADQAACAAFDHTTGPAGFPVLSWV